MRMTKVKSKNLALDQTPLNILADNLNLCNISRTHTLYFLYVWKFTLNTLSHIYVSMFNIKQCIICIQNRLLIRIIVSYRNLIVAGFHINFVLFYISFPYLQHFNSQMQYASFTSI